MKKILITGKDSYIGNSFEKYIKENFSTEFVIDTVDLKTKKWMDKSYAEYDVVFHVAGIVHKKETASNIHLYYEVNEDLAVRIAQKAKMEGVKQFIIMSSMSVYGMKTGRITKSTKPNPKTHYGISKYNADKRIMELKDRNYTVSVIRSPMVYGKNCKGNYQLLRKIALMSPVFPNIKNQRSMIYIDNLTEFIKKIIDQRAGGIFFPQDIEYVCTADMVMKIASCYGKHCILINAFNPVILLGEKIGINILNKVFGNLVYEKVDCIDVIKFDKAILETENK